MRQFDDMCPTVFGVGMGHQSQNSWTEDAHSRPVSQDNAPTVADWMQTVLGRAPQGPARVDGAQPHATDVPPQTPDGSDNGNKLQSRLAAIAQNIKTLESQVAETSAPVPQTTMAGRPKAPDSMDAPYQPAPIDPLEALRRRKRELEKGVARTTTVQSSDEGLGTAPGEKYPFMENQAKPSAGQTDWPVGHRDTAMIDHNRPVDTPNSMGDGHAQGAWERLSARLDHQFDRITQAIGDVRVLAQSNVDEQAALQGRVTALQSQLEAHPDGNAHAFHNAAMEQLSNQVRAVQDAISAMPKPEAMRSLEEGYNHVLARLDALKTVDMPSDRIDALYNDVDALRGVLDTLGGADTASLLGEMRTLIERLEQNPHVQADNLAETLASIQELSARGNDDHNSAQFQQAMGAVVERLVALEARIEALASGDNDQTVSRHLDTIQSEMERLSSFRDEIHGLTSVLDSMRLEMQSVAPPTDMSEINQRFAALDRIEEMMGGFADHVAGLSQRLAELDSRLSDQSDLAQEVAALSRELSAFQTAMPVREIEHALLDLTGRVTSLQEDSGAESFGMAVKQLGERVESCLNAVPSTDAIIDALEARIGGYIEGSIQPLFTRLEGLDKRLDGIQSTISVQDGPLIDHIAERLDVLVAAMPTARAEQALVSLETSLSELNARQAASGLVSREEVERLHTELARARASVELGTNRDLQRAIVDQVSHLADRFDLARNSGNADLLPEIESQVTALAERVHALGLFESPQQHQLSDDVAKKIGQHLGEVAPSPAMEDLRTDLSALRQNAVAQDERMQGTLKDVHKALETVLDRMNALESDDRAARHLAVDAGTDIGNRQKPDEVSVAPLGPLPEFDLPSPEVDALGDMPPAIEVTPPPIDPPEQPKTIDQDDPRPAPGDAQNLIKQLSGALVVPSESTQTSDEEPESSSDARSPGLSSTAADQRASFIAAARRAAQAAALQAGGVEPNRGSSTPSNPAVSKMSDLLGTKEVAKEPEQKIDPSWDDSKRPQGDHGQYPGEEGSGTNNSPLEALDEAARKARATDREAIIQAESKKRGVSRVVVLAAILLVLCAGLLAINWISSSEDLSAQVGAPSAPVETPAAEGSAIEDEDASAADSQTGDGDPSVALTPSTDEGSAAVGTTTTERESDQFGSETAFSGGFQREGGPVMVETPEPPVGMPASDGVSDQIDSASAEQNGGLTEPAPMDDTAAPQLSAEDLGPLLNLPVPSLPAATANVLPVAIGSPRLRVAAERGDAAAAFEVATRFMDGRVVQQDLNAAAHWYGRAADQNVAPAAYRLGSFYEQGRGVGRDRNAAIAWYERAALGGNPRAMHNLAVMAADGSSGSPDFARAAAWFTVAANRGLPDSQFNLAVLYARGMGVERDLMESYKWFALAANAGDGEAVGRRDEVAAVLGDEALALATARVDNWRPIPVDNRSVIVELPPGGWDDTPVRAQVAPNSGLIAEAQALLAQRGYDPGPADGMVGPRTSEAVRAFRQSVGLGDSQQIDQALIDALRAGATL